MRLIYFRRFLSYTEQARWIITKKKQAYLPQQIFKSLKVIFYWQRPAIVITERNGDLEVTHEFLTLEDYKQFKMLEDK